MLDLLSIISFHKSNLKACMQPIPSPTSGYQNWDDEYLLQWQQLFDLAENTTES